MIDAVVLADVTLLFEHQVDRLAHLALLEEGGIALGRHLNHLILGGVQLNLVFAGLLVGSNRQHVACHIHLSGVLVVQAKGHLVVSALHRLVILQADEVGSIVALKLHHNLQ